MTAVTYIHITCNGCAVKTMVEADNATHARRMLAEQGWKLTRRQVHGHYVHGDACPACADRRPAQVVPTTITPRQLLGSALETRRRKE